MKRLCSSSVQYSRRLVRTYFLRADLGSAVGRGEVDGVGEGRGVGGGGGDVVDGAGREGEMRVGCCCSCCCWGADMIARRAG